MEVPSFSNRINGPARQAMNRGIAMGHVELIPRFFISIGYEVGEQVSCTFWHRDLRCHDKPLL